MQLYLFPLSPPHSSHHTPRHCLSIVNVLKNHCYVLETLYPRSLLESLFDVTNLYDTDRFGCSLPTWLVRNYELCEKTNLCPYVCIFWTFFHFFLF